MNKYLLFTLFLFHSNLIPTAEVDHIQEIDKLDLKNVFVNPSDSDEIFQVVENMPRFPGCEDILGIHEKRQCASEKLQEYLAENVEHPEPLLRQRIQGTGVVRFIVEKDGTLSNICILRTIGEEANDEMRRIVELMNTDGLLWSPGTQRGVPVKVYFNLPIKFKLPPGGLEPAIDVDISVRDCGRKFEFSNFRAFPNPTSGSLTIDFDSASGLCARYSIIGVEGRLNWEGDLAVKDGSNRIELPIEDLHRGFHVLLLQNRKGGILKTYKFVKI